MSDHSIDDIERTLEYWVNACGALWPDVVAAAGAETSYRSIIFSHSADSVRVFYGETPPAWALAALERGVTKVAHIDAPGVEVERLDLSDAWEISWTCPYDGQTKTVKGDTLTAAWLAVAQRLWGGSDE